MRNKQGITLVSLVVTIIVLIILAGVSINLTLGENGIITMAKRARENMELAKIDEDRQLNELYEQIISESGSLGNTSEDAIIRLVEFKREIASALTDMGIETAENADASTMSNNIRSILGTVTADKVNYDNTSSGLTSTNLQGAVDEIDSEIDELNDCLGGLFTTVCFTAESNKKAVAAGEFVEYELSLADYTNEIIKNNISEYQPIGVTRISLASSRRTHVVEYRYDYTNNKYLVWVQNSGTSTETVYPYIYVTLVKKSLFLAN